ncbi:MAG: ABC transporter permease [Candidatus Omnitrophica bacterium]|nr:ABC transporter permease [Candidatus Omnitrophota bacterium]
MLKRLKNLYLYRHTLWDMSLKQVKAKYTASFLGIFWAVINPLLIMSAISFVFAVIFRIEIKNFSLFILAGIYPWLFFSSVLSESAGAILNQQTILHQFNLPREILPLSLSLAGFFNFLGGWLVVYPVFLFFNPHIIYLFPLLILILALNFIFLCGLSLALSVLNIFFRDLEHMLGTLLMFWFWVTPVFYSIEMVPEKFRWLTNLNPMSAYIIYYCDVLYRGVIPQEVTFIRVFLWALVSILSGFLIFIRLEKKILKRI